MNDHVTAVPREFEFREALAQERGDMPYHFGAQLLVPGLLYGVTTLVAWAMLSGALDLPSSWMDWLWIPGTLIYVPILLLLRHRARSIIAGEGARIWAAAWTSMGIMSLVVLIALVMARGRINAPFLLLWPPIAFALYGGAWATVGIVRRRFSYGFVAGGAFVTAVACAMLISTPAQWLAMGIGILVWVAGPGIVIVLGTRAAAPAASMAHT
jgi:hypothetical protein